VTELTCGMNYDDLLSFYSAFKNSYEIDQVAFWLVKSKVTREIFIQMEKEKESEEHPL